MKKLSPKAKKGLIVAGLGVVCVILVIAISVQFHSEAPKDAAVLPSTPAPADIQPDLNNPQPSTALVIAPDPAAPISSPAVPVDTSDSSGTEQHLQAEPTKPTPPVDPPTPIETPAVSKPEKTPEYKPEDTVKTKPKEPEGGEKKDGKIYVPGFGWIEDQGGGNSVDEVTSDGDINKQVGNMG